MGGLKLRLLQLLQRLEQSFGQIAGRLRYGVTAANPLRARRRVFRNDLMVRVVVRHAPVA